jgi:nucleotide-binding universal stress UspA family protein
MPDRPMLICYDGSKDARRAIVTAAAVLSPRPAVVLELTQPVTAEEEEAAFLFSRSPDNNLELRLRDVRRTAHRGVQLARAHGLDATERVDVAGTFWKGVVAVADDLDASVIVVDSRGLSGAREFVEGSLSHDLAIHAGRPLLVVPPAAGG